MKFFRTRNPVLGGMGSGIILFMGAVSLAESLSTPPRHTAIQVTVIVGFVLGAVLTYVGMLPKSASSDER